MKPDLLRIADRIDVRHDEHGLDVAALNQRFADAATPDLLAVVLGERLLGRIALVSSFGSESAVLLHLVAQIDADTPILFLDTGKHFPETLAYRDTLTAALGLSTVISLSPDAATLEARDREGLRWSYDPDGCCAIRKVAPLEQALVGYDATISGRKGFQARTRTKLALFEADGARVKLNPLAHWTKADIEAYAVRHALPPHPLTAQGYPSIGCAPCTSRVQPGEDPRAGRWRGWDKTECGIHGAHDGRADDPIF